MALEPGVVRPRPPIVPAQPERPRIEGPFAFLNDLEPPQITQLVDGIGAPSTAMVLAQLPEDIQVQILPTLSRDAMFQGQLAVQLSTQKTIPPEIKAAIAKSLEDRQKRLPPVPQVIEGQFRVGPSRPAPVEQPPRLPGQDLVNEMMALQQEFGALRPQIEAQRQQAALEREQQEAQAAREAREAEEEAQRQQVKDEVIEQIMQNPYVIADIVQGWIDKGAEPIRSPAQGVPPEIRDQLAKMSGLQRTGAFLIGIGPESAAILLKQLKDEDIERVTLEIGRIRNVPWVITQALIEEVHKAAIGESTTHGGLEFAQEVLTRAFDPQRAAELTDRLAARAKGDRFGFLHELDTFQIMTALQNEHPQTIALVLSHLVQQGGEKQAAQILTMLSPDMQAEIIERIAYTDKVSSDVVGDVVRLLRRKTSAYGSQARQSTVGGVKAVKSILDKADPSASKALLDKIDEMSPELADEIKRISFEFTDIPGKISDEDLIKVVNQMRLDDPSLRELAIALRKASPELRRKFFNAMSMRNEADLNNLIEEVGPQRLYDVEQAQQKIIARMRGLEQAEVITIGKKEPMVYTEREEEARRQREEANAQRIEQRNERRTTAIPPPVRQPQPTTDTTRRFSWLPFRRRPGDQPEISDQT